MSLIIPFHPPDDYDFDKLPFPPSEFHGSREEQIKLVNAVRDNFPECNKAAAAKWSASHGTFLGNQHPPMCHYHSDGARVFAFHMCEAHSFLHESDEPGRTVEWTVPRLYGHHHAVYGTLPTRVTRMDRLMFIRRTREHWLAQEGILQHCTKCDEIYQVRHDCPAERRGLRSQITQFIFDDPHKPKDPEDFDW